VSSDGTNQVMTSPDGITWTARNATQANLWNDVIYGNGQFVAVSGNGTNQVMTSPDGINWTARNAAGVAQWFSLAYGGGKFVAVAPGGVNRTMYSHDGITWIAPTAVASNNWVNVVYGNSGFVAVSDNGANQVITLDCTVGCSAPAGTAGAMIYNTTSRVVQWCDGNTWHAAGPIGPTGPNGGCSSPTGAGGDMMFNALYNKMQYCNGDQWVSIGREPGISCSFDSALVAHWKFDETAGTTAADATGNAPGTLANGPVWRQGQGVSLGALEFDGSNDIVNVGSVAALSQGNFTVAAWFRPDVSKIAAIAEHARSSTNWYGAFQNMVQLHGRFNFGNGGHTGNGGTVALSTWNHHTVTYDVGTTTGRIYDNGVQVHSSTGAADGSALGNFTIGNNSANEAFDGLLDEVRVYNRALTAAEIAQLYNNCP
jgi:hypothetical protein